MYKSCTKCGERKSLELFYRNPKSSDGRRPDCKDCSNKQKRDRNEQKPYQASLIAMSNGILKRVKHDVHKRKNKSYKDKNIQCLIGETAGEIREFLHNHFEKEIIDLLKQGIVPSVDRIDSNKHYEQGNIRIISLEENSKLGIQQAIINNSQSIKCIFPNGKEKTYQSIISASKDLGIDRGTVSSNLNRGTVTRHGYVFEKVFAN